jgi:hypothetical protein
MEGKIEGKSDVRTRKTTKQLLEGLKEKNFFFFFFFH